MRHHLDLAVADVVSLIAQGMQTRIAYLHESEHKLSSSNLNCYEAVVKYFSAHCFKISEVSRTHNISPFFKFLVR